MSIQLGYQVVFRMLVRRKTYSSFSFLMPSFISEAFLDPALLSIQWRSVHCLLLDCLRVFITYILVFLLHFFSPCKKLHLLLMLLPIQPDHMFYFWLRFPQQTPPPFCISFPPLLHLAVAVSLSSRHASRDVKQMRGNAYREDTILTNDPQII